MRCDKKSDKTAGMHSKRHENAEKPHNLPMVSFTVDLWRVVVGRHGLPWWLAAAVVLGVGALPVQAQSPPAAASESLSEDGSLVIDQRARLAWARCVEGMLWNGQTCTGQARLLTYKQAQTLVRERGQQEGVRWRLPRVNELRRLVNRNQRPPTVDTQLFPNAPRQWHWTGTSSVNAARVNPYAYDNVARGGEGAAVLGVQQAWAVDMASGEGKGDVPRSTQLVVRLLRPMP